MLCVYGYVHNASINLRAESMDLPEIVTSTDPDGTEDFMRRQLNTVEKLFQGYQQTHILYYGSGAPGYAEMAEALTILQDDLSDKIQQRLNRETDAIARGGRVLR